MPATYERLAVDFDGDGRRDLVDNSRRRARVDRQLPAKRGGWQSGLPGASRCACQPASTLPRPAARASARSPTGLAPASTLVNGRPLTASGLAAGERVGLLLPAGPRGPAFLTTRNFDVIYGYNAAESYALAIAHLADRLRGGAPFATPWPTDDPGISRAERRELQTLLAARGHDIGEIDGALGDRSRAAIKLEQARLGQPATGRGGGKLLDALRNGR